METLVLYLKKKVEEDGESEDAHNFVFYLESDGRKELIVLNKIG